MFQVPFPLYDSADQRHTRLAALAAHAEQVAAGVELSTGSFQVQRSDVRAALVADGVAGDLDSEVVTLIGKR